MTLIISNPETVREVLSIADGSSRSPVSQAECENLWRSLVERRASIVGWSSDAHHWHLVLAQGPSDRAARALPQRNCLILEGFLLGVPPKVMSSDLGIATSSVAQILRNALFGIGVDCTPARVPPLLVILLHVARGRSGVPLTLQRVECAGTAFTMINGAIDARPHGLTRAQLEVLGLRLVGKSHAAIAVSRSTSRRTVANQLAAATHRLGVSGRLDLLRFMAVAPWTSQDVPPARFERPWSLQVHCRPAPVRKASP